MIFIKVFTSFGDTMQVDGTPMKLDASLLHSLLYFIGSNDPPCFSLVARMYSNPVVTCPKQTAYRLSRSACSCCLLSIKHVICISILAKNYARKVFQILLISQLMIYHPAIHVHPPVYRYLSQTHYSIFSQNIW